MPTLFETFVNAELPKRIATNEPTSNVEAGDLPVYTGLGLLTEAKTASELGLAKIDDLGSAAFEDVTAFDTAGSADEAEDNAKAYADSLVVGLWDDRGGYNPTGTSLYPTSSNGGSGDLGAVLKGDIWTVSVAGTINGITVQIGDTVRALQDVPADNTNAHWAIGENNIGYIPENQVNKATNFSTVDNTKYPSVKAVNDRLSALPDDVLRIVDGTDNTKKIAFEVQNVASGNTSTVSFPNANVNLGDIPTGISFANNTLTLTQLDGGVLTTGISALREYTNNTQYNLWDLVRYGGLVFLVTEAHTTPTSGTQPNGKIELVSGTFLGAPSIKLGNGIPNKQLIHQNYSLNPTIDLTNATSAMTLCNTAGFSARNQFLLSRPGTTFYSQDGDTLGNGSASVYVEPIGRLDIVCNTTQTILMTSQQQVLGKFKLYDLSTAGACKKVTFQGVLTSDRSLTMADANVDLNILPTVAKINGHSLTGSGSAIVSGNANSVFSAYSIVGSGQNHNISGNNSAILGGISHIVTGTYSSILGGSINTVSGANSAVLAGQNNRTYGNNSVTIAGSNNWAQGFGSVILSGHYGRAKTDGEIVFGANYSGIVGGPVQSASKRTMLYAEILNTTSQYVLITGGFTGSVFTSGNAHQEVLATGCGDIASDVNGLGMHTFNIVGRATSGGVSTFAGRYTVICEPTGSSTVIGAIHTEIERLSGPVGLSVSFVMSGNYLRCTVQTSVAAYYAVTASVDSTYI